MSDEQNGSGAAMPRIRIAPIPSARPALPRAAASFDAGLEDPAAGAPAATGLAALTTPYTLERWREELTRMASGYPTRIDVLEDVGMRWVPGKVYAVIARPGGGKTAFLLETCARAIEADPAATAVLCSWEEPLAELVVRLFLRADARARADGAFVGDPIPRADVRKWGRGGLVDGLTAERLHAAQPAVEQLLARFQLVDGDTLGRYVQPVLRAVATWMRTTEHRPALVAVDYFQKLRAAGQFGGNGQRELKEVADALRAFAKGDALGADDPDPAGTWAVAVLVGAQVNRADLAIGHPSGDNIREADDLLNDAAAVIALSYVAGDEHAVGAQRADEQRTLRVSVPKHRDGRTRKDEVALLAWRPARAWIADSAKLAGTGYVLWESCKMDEGQEPGRGGARNAGEERRARRRTLEVTGASGAPQVLD